MIRRMQHEWLDQLAEFLTNRSVVPPGVPVEAAALRGWKHRRASGKKGVSHRFTIRREDVEGATKSGGGGA